MRGRRQLSTSVRKTHAYLPFSPYFHPVTKTGSGRTQGKHSKGDGFFAGHCPESADVLLNGFADGDLCSVRVIRHPIKLSTASLFLSPDKTIN
jgi:hypothetical protein